MEVECFLSLGSNINKREENLKDSIDFLKGENKLKILKKSSIYETEPWGVEKQPPFLNMVLKTKTKVSPTFLLNICKRCELKLGRKETLKWGSRIIDVDILFYGNQILDKPKLKIPHPLLHKRRFILIPLAEIEPLKTHPLLKKTIIELLEELNDKKWVNKWGEI